MHKITTLLAALALTACSINVDSQYGIRLEPRRIVRPETEPPQSSASERAAESLSGLEHSGYVDSDVFAQPESPFEAPTAEFHVEEPLQKQRWVLEIPREEIPAMAQPFVDRAAEFNEASEVQTRKKFSTQVLNTAARIILGIILCALAITLGLFALFYAVLGQISWDPNDYGTIAGQYFVAGIVALALGLFVMFVGF